MLARIERAASKLLNSRVYLAPSLPDVAGSLHPLAEAQASGCGLGRLEVGTEVGTPTRSTSGGGATSWRTQ